MFFETVWKLITKYGHFFTEGLRNTLLIAIIAVVVGTVLGALMALMRMSRIAPLRWLATAYIEFFRGTPLMVQLMFIFYGLPMIGVSFPEISFIPDFSRFMAGIVAMSLNSCAYVAEVIRSGIQAVDPGQMEAARSLGFKKGEAMRIVVLPQAIRNILPALGNGQSQDLQHAGMPVRRRDPLLCDDLLFQQTGLPDGKEDGAWPEMNCSVWSICPKPSES